MTELLSIHEARRNSFSLPHFLYDENAGSRGAFTCFDPKQGCDKGLRAGAVSGSDSREQNEGRKASATYSLVVATKDPLGAS